MIAQAILDGLVRAIHAQPELAGCVIGFEGNLTSRVLHPGDATSLISERCIVVIEECESGDPTVLQNTQSFARMQGSSPQGAPGPIIATNRSKIGQELVGAGLTCGLTVVSAVGVFGGVAGEVPTGGVSTFLVVVAWTGFVTQGLECLNGLVRVGMIAEDPDATTLQALDDNKYYAAAVLLNDAINMAANLTALPFAARDLWAVIIRQRSFIERGLTLAVLKNMNRAERMQVISEIFVEASRTPEGKVSLIEAAREAQVGPQSIQRAAGLSVQQADKMVRIVSDETIRRLNNSALMVAGGILGPVISGTPARFTGSASGSVNWIINVVEID